MPTTQAYCNACGVNRSHEILHSAKSAESYGGDPLLGQAAYDTLQCTSCGLTQLRPVRHLSGEEKVMLWGKRLLPIAVFLGAILALGLAGQYVWMQYQDFSTKNLESKQERLSEKEIVTQFVASHPEVMSAVGAPVQATITGYSSRFFGFKPFLYVVSASGKARVLHAYIKVDREVNPAALTLACIADPSKVESGSLGDACTAASGSLK